MAGKRKAKTTKQKESMGPSKWRLQHGGFGEPIRDADPETGSPVQHRRAVDTLGAMQATLATTVRTHSRQIAKAFRLADQRAAKLPPQQLDPDRPLTKGEREKALHMFRSGVNLPNMSKRLNRTHGVLERWAASEPEVVRSLVGRGLF